MKRVSLLSLVMILSAMLTSAQQRSKESLASFVAFDKYAGLSNPREPKQILIIEIKKGVSFKPLQLVKVIYFPKTSGFRGGAEFLGIETLKNGRSWWLKLRQPSKSEQPYCEITNFLMTFDGEVDLDEKAEPTMRFGSTQIDGDIKFNGLAQMPCMIIDSLR